MRARIRAASRSRRSDRDQLGRPDRLDPAVRPGHGDGVHGGPLAPAATSTRCTSGAWAAELRHGDHLVPARWRPVHRLHVHRRARGDVRHGRGLGFFAVPYTVMLYPIIFFFLARLWSVAHRHGYVTTADFVQGRYGTQAPRLAVALTGILATMPYIALQLVGIQAVLEVVGIGGSGHWPATFRC